MTFNPEELAEILSIYKAESEEHLQKLEEGLLYLEREPARGDVLEEVFREAHSLKGSARMIGFAAVERIAHRMEDLFGAARKGEVPLSPEIVDVLLKALDTVARVTEAWLSEPEREAEGVEDALELIEATCRGESARREGVRGRPAREGKAGKKGKRKDREGKDEARLPAVSAAEVAPPPAVPGERRAAAKEAEAVGAKVKFPVEETIRVNTLKLDNLMNRIGEIIVTKIKFDQRLAEIRRLDAEAEAIYRAWGRKVREGEKRETGSSRELVPSAGEGSRDLGARISRLYNGLGSLLSGFSEDSLRLTLISSELQESINRVRMLPLSALFNLFPRLLRDIAREEGKEAGLSVKGGDVQLDKRIIEELKDPLMHLLRNALDHGVESPEERSAAGKERAGRIRLTALQKASSVQIDIEDDGRGLDLERIRALGLRRGFVNEHDLLEMNDQQIMALVFRSGFSTKGLITDLSGRGVGLDVVHNKIEKLKGTITLSSERGKGAKFSIRLPVTLTTSQALFVRVGRQVFAIPLTAVETVLEVGLDEVMSLESREAIVVEGVPTAVVGLHEIMGLQPDSLRYREGENVPVVVIGSTEERVALTVSEVIGEKEIVVKGLGSQLRRVRNISGATIMGDGRLVLILNVFDLIKSSQKARGLWAAGEKRRVAEAGARPEILVADDSVTTRVLEKNILEGSGFSVTLAVDGVDALEKLRSRSFDLVVSDVEMPRMSGFELTRQIRCEEQYRNLPVILVTSLDSDEDKKRGIEVGADAYITKGSFEQGNLLDTIRQLL